MKTQIGPLLREARFRRKIELADVEQQTKIRVRYLRALENEEWSVLPGGAYTRGFIRTYASFLGLDGERIAEEFRQLHQATNSAQPSRREPVASPAWRDPGTRRWRFRIGTGPAAVLISAALIALLVVLGLTAGHNNARAPQPRSATSPRSPAAAPATKAPAPVTQNGPHLLSLKATASVWVCLIDGTGARLVNGRILTAGQRAGPFRAPKFDFTLGNGQVTMQLDGRGVTVPPTSSPVGYELSKGKLRPLTGTQRPTCA